MWGSLLKSTANNPSREMVTFRRHFHGSSYGVSVTTTWFRIFADSAKAGNEYIKYLLFPCSSTSALRPGSSPGCHTWILLAVIHLTMDFSACSPPTPGLGGKLSARSVPRLKTSPTILWEAPSRPSWRSQGLGWKKGLHPLQQPTNKAGRSPTLVGQKRRGPTHGGPGCEECPLQAASGDAQASPASPEGRNLDSGTSLPRLRRQLKWDTSERTRESRTTTVPGFIDWGPTGGDDGGEDDGRAVPSTTVSVKATTTTTTTTVSTTTKRPRNSERIFVVTTMLPRRQSTTPPSVSFGETAKPAKPIGDTAGESHVWLFLWEMLSFLDSLLSSWEMPVLSVKLL